MAGKEYSSDWDWVALLKADIGYLEWPYEVAVVIPW